MATTKPRITITLTERQHQLLKAIGEGSGFSMSSLVVDILEASEPVLERMAVTFQKLKQASDSQKSHLAKTLDEAQTAFEPLVTAGLDQLDMFFGQLEHAATREISTDDSAAAPALIGRATPVPSPNTNRGVTPLRANHRKPASSKAKKVVSEKKVFKKTQGC